ncbi:Z1 domain-containing protein [Vagococcus fluvialis]|uniref:Z1 domain-containing protein n=1 Tax=Vagococcus fluvialis TaxID=2738 RepID=UPI00288E0918|nr:Z1 domain-containing protein [Vagococcus fluvialis]MDT2745946.1 Z1 domain-containing protein [Vagococcus fluvialis]
MIDHDLIEKHFDTARSAIESEKKYRLDEITEHLKLYKEIFKMNDETFRCLTYRILECVSVSLDEGDILPKKVNSNWFVQTRINRGTRRYDAYEKYLEHVSGYSTNVITSIGNSMDKAMNNIGDPLSEGTFFTKGLVIGDVQSGKTGNFIALMNKAADAGYNVIVVTTGTIEKLRRQTQDRIEQGFGGFDSGEFDVKKTIKNWDKDLEALMVTTKTADFKKNVNFTTGISKSVPMVAVIKKNKTSLESLAAWLEKHNGDRIDRSLLFIDDEADNATINTKDAEEPTTINKGIRKILSLFKRSSYVGFTATPFANVLVDHTESDDLFPSDFIQVLDTPSNYMGPSNIFPEDGKYHSILKSNDDAKEKLPIVIPKKQRTNFVVEELPDSLREAIKIFFIQNAVRDVRGDKNKHRSMLVNVSHLVYIQEQVNDLITNEVGDLKRKIKYYILDQNSSIHLELKQLFETEFSEIPEDWDEIYGKLYASTDQIINEVINAQNKGFQYENFPTGARVIAVGGFALSRGLTLEGLSISYLYRNTLMYDTLMQMGRWFGYRPNYADIIKLYMPNHSIDWYYQILEATNDLKRQLRNMVNQHQKPEDFGLYIREANNKDEAVLLITARNKMKHATNQDVVVRISGDYKETTKLPLEYASFNRELIENWIENYKEEFDESLLIKNANKEIVKEILLKYKYGNYNKLNSTVVNEVLKEFDKFDIKIAGNRGSTIYNLKNRNRLFRYEPELKVIAFSNSRVGSISDGRYGLDAQGLEKSKDFNVQKLYFSEFEKNERNPLLVLYPEYLNPSKDKATKKFYEDYKEDTFWALSLGVPQTGKNPLVYKTKMNTVLKQQLLVGKQIEDFAVMDEIEEDIS